MTTIAPTRSTAIGRLVHRGDQIQYDLGSGPCVDAVVGDTTSMLSIRLFIETDADLTAGLNLYSHQPTAFDEYSEAVAQMLAAHGSRLTGGRQGDRASQGPEPDAGVGDEP